MSLLAKTKLLAKEVIIKYYDNGVARSAASLAYFLIFSLFPFLIFVNMLLGFMNISADSIVSMFKNILPDDVINIVIIYIKYVTDTVSKNAFIFSLAFTIYIPIRTVKNLMFFLNKAYCIYDTRPLLKRTLFLVLFTFLFMFAIISSLAILILGENTLGFISDLIYIPDNLISFWSDIRFLILAAMLFLLLSLLYTFSSHGKYSKKYIFSGSLFALFTWLAVSSVFAFYVNSMGRYSVLYGSIGAIIVLMVWLYISATIILLGAEFNHALYIVDKRDINGGSNEKH